MAAVTETFIELFKRQPNEADKIRLMSVQKALRLPDDDPLWTILIALDYYQKLYDEAPARIVAATQTAARTAITAAEASTTEKLVNGAVAIASERMERVRVSQWPLVIVCIVLAALLVGLGVSFWFATQRLQAHELATVASYEEKLVTTREQYNHTLATRISEVQTAAANQLAQGQAELNKDKAVLDWARQYRDLYRDKDFQDRVDFVAQNQVFVDAVRPLTVTQRDNLLRIITKADHWRGVLSSAALPWPCFAVGRPAGQNNRDARLCQVGLEGDITPPHAGGHHAAPPQKTAHPLPATTTPMPKPRP